jgi:hypothetical protein
MSFSQKSYTFVRAVVLSSFTQVMQCDEYTSTEPFNFAKDVYFKKTFFKLY